MPGILAFSFVCLSASVGNSFGYFSSCLWMFGVLFCLICCDACCCVVEIDWSVVLCNGECSGIVVARFEIEGLGI